MTITSTLPAVRGDRRVARSVVVAVLLGVGVVAAAGAVDPAGIHPFTTLRWPLVTACVLLAGATGWSVRPLLPPALVAVGLAFLGWMTVATVVAEDGLIAWIGHPQRHFGVLAWFVCAVGFAVGVSLDRSGRAVLGWSACAGCVLLGSGALLELVGVDIAGASFPGARTGGFLGQPAYLAALGVILVPVAVGVAAEHRGRARLLLGAAAAAGVFAVVTSQTRGAWVALVAAGVLGWARGRRTLRIHPLAVASVVFVGAIVLVASGIGPGLASLVDRDGGLGPRVDEWHLAATVAADHPLVGTGPEGYRLVAPSHIDAAYSERYGREVVVDRAHDGILEVAVTGGLPAAALYVALLGLVGVRLWRARRDTSPVVAGAAIGAMAYGMQQLVLFPIAEIDPLAWLVAGVAVAATVAPRSAGGPGRRSAVAVPLVLAVAAVGVLVGGALDLSADRLLARARSELAAGDQVGALAAADAATGRRPDSIDAWYVAAEVAAAGPSLVDVDVALDRVASGLQRSSLDPALLDLRERLLVERAVRSGLYADRQAASGAIDQRHVSDPTNPVHEELRATLERSPAPGGGAG